MRTLIQLNSILKELFNSKAINYSGYKELLDKIHELQDEIRKLERE